MSSAPKRLKFPEPKKGGTHAGSEKKENGKLEHANIERLAYIYWCERGCPDGSPEEDWYRAEGTLRTER